MPRNNSRSRKEWRKENADFNVAYWEREDPQRVADRKGLTAKPYGMKPYRRDDRPPRP